MRPRAYCCLGPAGSVPGPTSRCAIFFCSRRTRAYAPLRRPDFLSRRQQSRLLSRQGPSAPGPGALVRTAAVRSRGTPVGVSGATFERPCAARTSDPDGTRAESDQCGGDAAPADAEDRVLRTSDDGSEHQQRAATSRCLRECLARSPPSARTPPALAPPAHHASRSVAFGGTAGEALPTAVGRTFRAHAPTRVMRRSRPAPARLASVAHAGVARQRRVRRTLRSRVAARSRVVPGGARRGLPVVGPDVARAAARAHASRATSASSSGLPLKLGRAPRRRAA